MNNILFCTFTNFSVSSSNNIFGIRGYLGTRPKCIYLYMYYTNEYNTVAYKNKLTIIFNDI